MPSLIALKQLPANERRRAPRFLVKLETPLFVGVASVNAKGKPRTFTGRVRDISELGLSIVLPPGEECGMLADKGRELMMVISLPKGTLTPRGAVVHCNEFDGGEAENGYVIGVRFTEVSEGDGKLIAEFLKAGVNGD
jgi:hypothetical protein